MLSLFASGNEYLPLWEWYWVIFSQELFHAFPRTIEDRFSPTYESRRCENSLCMSLLVTGQVVPRDWKKTTVVCPKWASFWTGLSLNLKIVHILLMFTLCVNKLVTRSQRTYFLLHCGKSYFILAGTIENISGNFLGNWCLVYALHQKHILLLKILFKVCLLKIYINVCFLRLMSLM